MSWKWAQVLGLALQLLYEKTDDATRALAERMIKRKGRP